MAEVAVIQHNPTVMARIKEAHHLRLGRAVSNATKRAGCETYKTQDVVLLEEEVIIEDDPTHHHLLLHQEES